MYYQEIPLLGLLPSFPLSSLFVITRPSPMFLFSLSVATVVDFLLLIVHLSLLLRSYRLFFQLLPVFACFGYVEFPQMLFRSANTRLFLIILSLFLELVHYQFALLKSQQVRQKKLVCLTALGLWQSSLKQSQCGFWQAAELRKNLFRSQSELEDSYLSIRLLLIFQFNYQLCFLILEISSFLLESYFSNLYNFYFVYFMYNTHSLSFLFNFYILSLYALYPDASLLQTLPFLIYLGF